jgi:uncharacterized protein
MDMAALYGLQVVDTAIEQAEHARPRLPEVVQHEAGLAELMAVRREIDGVRSRQLSAQEELDRIEQASSEIDAQRAKFEKQLKTIISPREAEALQHEMQSLAAHRNELDDRGIELLEASSAADEELVALVDREGRVASAESVLLDDRQRAEVEADRVLADLRAKRIEIAAGIASNDLSEYERRRKSFGGIAVSRIEHGICTGCRMEISIAELDSIKRQPAETDVECPNCSRFLLR